MPEGHPEHHKFYKSVNYTKPEDLPGKGILKCRILPPRGLYLPTIPVKHQKMLIFGLCRSCIKKYAGKKLERQLECTHSDEQRSLIVTSSSQELEISLANGYRIDYIYDAYFWKKWTKNIFQGFIKDLLKVKIESSGPPENIDKDVFLATIYEKYGFHLDVSKWLKNAGLRTISKLLLNSCWG